ncbi:hypothetical protein LJR230_004054 [Trinickia sp. LjRoot230]|uniref:hypothetical protein n=1 Tax=Trinickia sp. LjRoot230 TaxID=3342288 RepID=UPI003ECD055C
MQAVLDRFSELKAAGLSAADIVKLANGRVTEAGREKLPKLAAQIPPLPEAPIQAVLDRLSELVEAAGLSAADIVKLAGGQVTEADKRGVDSGHTLEKYESGLDSTVAPKPNDDAEQA